MKEQETKYSVKDKIENFWYYHKGIVIACLILIFMVGLTLVNKLTIKKSDLTIALITAAPVTEENIRIGHALTPVMTDINNDNGAYLTTAQFPIAEDASDEQSQNYIKLLESQLSNRAATLFIVDKPNLDRLLKKDAFSPLDDFFSIKDYADRIVYHNEKPMAFHLVGSNTLSEIGFTTDDLYALLLFHLPEDKENPVREGEFKNAVSVLTELMK